MDKIQGLIDPIECEQPGSGTCGLAECEPGERCTPCVQALSQAGRKESVAPCPIPNPEPCLASGEVEPETTWQMIIAAQHADPVLSQIILQLTAGTSGLLVSLWTGASRAWTITP